MKAKIIFFSLLAWFAIGLAVMAGATIDALRKGDGSETLLFCLFWPAVIVMVLVAANEVVEWRKGK